MMRLKNKRIYKILLIICTIVLLILAYKLITKNENNNTNNVSTLLGKDEIGLQVLMYYDATEEQINKLGNDLKQIEGITNITFISKEEAYNIMRKRLAENESAIEGFTPDIFSISYIVNVKDEKDVKSIENKIKNLENVRDVSNNVEARKHKK